MLDPAAAAVGYLREGGNFGYPRGEVTEDGAVVGSKGHGGRSFFIFVQYYTNFYKSLLTLNHKFANISVTDISKTDMVMNPDLNANPPMQPLTPAVFHILLALSEQEQHGYRIMQLVEIQSGGAVKMGPGTLYGSIKRMLNDGLIEEAGARLEPAQDDQRRRYYRLTRVGRKALRSESERLANLVAQAREKNIFSSSFLENI
jgi:DNA-binding PadR family transcriptional regulator